MLNSLNGWANSLSVIEITSLACLFLVTFLLKRAALGIHTFALIAWPGTVCHELAHALVGFLLRAKPCNISLMPKHLGDGHWQLGSVSFANMRWWNAPWTAMAPLLLAPLAFWLTAHWVTSAWQKGHLLAAFWFLVLCSIILQASWPSTTDFRVAFPGLVVLAMLALGVHWLF